MIDNIIIGTPLVPLSSLIEDKHGNGRDDTNIHLELEEVLTDEGVIFLPHVLVRTGMFKSTSQIKQINTQRQKTRKYTNDPYQNLWRHITNPEMTKFKIGKNVFWLIVGQ